MLRFIHDAVSPNSERFPTVVSEHKKDAHKRYKLLHHNGYDVEINQWLARTDVKVIDKFRTRNLDIWKCLELGMNNDMLFFQKNLQSFQKRSQG